MYNVYINKFSEHTFFLLIVYSISRKLTNIYSIKFIWKGQYSHDDAYTVKKAYDYLAAESSLAIAGNLH
jgi:hypothetical protein